MFSAEVAPSDTIPLGRASCTISQLADAAGVTPRTVRFYTAEGLLPPPDARGRFALYSDEHLDRLKLILQLKERFLPLNSIRERLQAMSGEQVRALLAEVESRPPAAPLDDLIARTAAPPRPAALESPGLSPLDSEHWERIPLAPGVELHIRLPVVASQRERIDRVTADARQLLAQEGPESGG